MSKAYFDAKITGWLLQRLTVYRLFEVFRERRCDVEKELINFRYFRSFYQNRVISTDSGFLAF